MTLSRKSLLSLMRPVSGVSVVSVVATGPPVMETRCAAVAFIAGVYLPARQLSTSSEQSQVLVILSRGVNALLIGSRHQHHTHLWRIIALARMHSITKRAVSQALRKVRRPSQSQAKHEFSDARWGNQRVNSTVAERLSPSCAGRIVSGNAGGVSETFVPLQAMPEQ